jgi:LacI family transcriptional regulator
MCKPFHIVIKNILYYNICNMRTTARLRIGLQVENSRAHGRLLLAGIADFALSHQDWQFDSLTPEQVKDPEVIAPYDGLIVRVMDDETSDVLSASGKPVIDTYGRNGSVFNTIRLDDTAIAEMAAQFFAEHRFSTCAYCGFRGPRFSAARGAAFVSILEKAGQICQSYGGEKDAKIADTFFRNERADYVPDAKALSKWIKSLPKPIAVFCCNDVRAYQIIKICEAEGLSVPSDVAVLGVDNDILFCTFTRPPLSSIDTNPFQLGYTAAEMLGELMDSPGESAEPVIRLHSPKKIIERGTTETFPFKVRWLSDAMVFIRRNLDRGISANDVIKHLGYSHTAVNNAFRAEIGSSVQQEIIRERIALARRLLKETTRPAAKIALEAGFKNPQYFSRTFASATGLTPDAWRRKNAARR